MKRVPLPLPGESFRQHPVHAHLLVSDLGRVYSLKSHRLVGRAAGGNGKTPGAPATYASVTVGSTRPQPNVYVHTLVLETFVGPRPEGHEGDHLNFDRQDNRLANLRWLPAEENRARRLRFTAQAA